MTAPKTGLAHKAWHPAEYTADDAMAIQAVNAGVASEAQQKRVMLFIIATLCRTYDLSFDPESQRNSDFAEGSRWVGLQLVKLTKVNVSKVREIQERKLNERRARKA